MSERVIIRTENIRKIYGMGEVQVAALNGVSLNIKEGEFVAIMGPSGSGKSTLMNILGCLDRPSEGRYFLNEEDVSDLSREELAVIRNRELGFIFQSYNLLPKIDAVENIILPMMYKRQEKLSPSQMEERALAALESVGLADRAHHLPKELSGGQQQRVAIARALINDPVLVLADEPTGNLDSKSSIEIMDLLHELHGRGRTIVMVTHEPEIAEHTQRVIHILDGRVDKDYQNGHRFGKLSTRSTDEVQAAAGTGVQERSQK